MEDNMLKQFKSEEQLAEYANAQYKTIVELSKKIQKLEEEKAHLELVLASSTPILESERPIVIGTQIPNEQLIAEVQLYKLRLASDSRELTLEEARKTETYSKILANLRTSEPEKPAEKEAKSYTHEELLKALAAPGESNE